MNLFIKIFQYIIILIYLILIVVLLIDIYDIATNVQKYPLNYNSWSYCSVKNYIITNVFFILFFILSVCLYFIKNKSLFNLSFLIFVLYILFFLERNW